MSQSTEGNAIMPGNPKDIVSEEAEKRLHNADSGQIKIAALALVNGLVDTSNLIFIERGYTAPVRLLELRLRALSQAIEGMSKLSIERVVSITWPDEQNIHINDVKIDGLQISNFYESLKRNFLERGIIGLHFQKSFDENNLSLFFNSLKSAKLEELSLMAGDEPFITFPQLPGALIELIQDHKDGPELLSSNSPGIEISSSNSFETSFTTELMRSRLDFERGEPVPIVSTKKIKLNVAQKREVALNIYTHLLAFSEHLLLHKDEKIDRKVGFPEKAALRLLIQLNSGFEIAEDYLLACVLLNMNDPSQAKRLSHQLMLGLGFGRWLGLAANQLAVLGIALMVRQRAIDPKAPSSLNELRQFQNLKRISPLLFQGIHLALLVSNSDRTEQCPLGVELLKLLIAFTACLDGDHGQSPPLSCVASYQKLARSNHTLPLLKALIAWLGPIPPGTIVRLKDDRIAVIEGPRHRKKAFLLNFEALSPQDNVQQSLRDTIRGWPSPSPYLQAAITTLLYQIQNQNTGIDLSTTA